MKILIAPDKFKGSLSAQEVCHALRDGIHAANASYDITMVPLADGGEGTADLLTHFSQGRKIHCTAMDPLRRPIASSFGVSHDGSIAFIEMTSASGLHLLKPKERNPMNTTSYGTGQLIAKAMEGGARKIILGIGGSATNDGGAGMAEALGFIFLSSSGNQLSPIGSNLIHINSIRTQSAHPLLHQTAFTVLHDVGNPLFGKHGAAFVYAPQKGANPQQVSLLDQGLEHLAGIISGRFHMDINFPGAGAAGGLGAGAKFFLKAELRSGIDFVMEFVKLEDHIRSAELVITGEGKIDQQTFSGKVVAGVARLAARHQKKCVAFAGVSEVSSGQYKRIGLSEIVTTTGSGVSNQYSMENAFPLLKEAGRKYFSPPSVNH